MSEIAHTPGPWFAEQPGISGVNVSAEKSGVGIAWCGTNSIFGRESHVISTAEARANACLIATAPELLEALEELIKAINFVHPEAHEAVAAAEQKARAAIAKAKEE